MIKINEEINTKKMKEKRENRRGEEKKEEMRMKDQIWKKREI